MKKKLCITYITTSKYNIFWRDFYRSFDMNFCKDCDITFYVFTDDIDGLKNAVSDYNNCSNVKFFKIDGEFTNDADLLKFRKFKILNYAESLYPQFDYVFYFNGNLICRIPVSLDDLFNGKDQFAVYHSLFDKNTNNMKEQLCKNINSSAYFDISKYNNYMYYQSGNFGATPHKFQKIINFVESCRYYDEFYNMTKYIPWHDETYYNKYINILVNKDKDSINILDGKMYLCSWLPQLNQYSKICKMLLIYKDYFWKQRRGLFLNEKHF